MLEMMLAGVEKALMKVQNHVDDDDGGVLMRWQNLLLEMLLKMMLVLAVQHHETHFHNPRRAARNRSVSAWVLSDFL